MRWTAPRHGLRRLLACATIISAGVVPTHAQVSVESDSGQVGPHHISLAGRIDVYTLYSFVRLLSDPRISVATHPVVKLDSVGGSVTAAMAIGHFVRERGFTTVVEKAKECLSACVLILAAGTDRVVSSGRIGVHRPRQGVALAAPSSVAQTRAGDQLLDDMRRYLQTMGMGERLFAAMIAVPPESMKMLKRSEMHAFGLIAGEEQPPAVVTTSPPVTILRGAKAADVRKSAFSPSVRSRPGQQVAARRGKAFKRAARKILRGQKAASLARTESNRKETRINVNAFANFG